MRKPTPQPFESRLTGIEIAEEITKPDQSVGGLSERDGVREYIALMALELAALAKKQDSGFLAYLLNLAFVEANSSKVRISYRS